jgi:hypothetical protein
MGVLNLCCYQSTLQPVNLNLIKNLTECFSRDNDTRIENENNDESESLDHFLGLLDILLVIINYSFV